MTTHRVIIERQGLKQNTNRIAFCIVLLYILDSENIEDAMLEKLLQNFVAWDKERYKYIIAAKSRRFHKRKIGPNWSNLSLKLNSEGIFECLKNAFLNYVIESKILLVQKNLNSKH